MNWPLVLAGVIGVTAALVHGVVGDRIVRRSTSKSVGGTAAFLIRVTWHFTTIAFGVMGIALVVAGVAPDAAGSNGIAYAGALLFSCWSAFVLIAGFARGGIRGWVAHPAPLLLSAAAALSWWGTTWP